MEFYLFIFCIIYLIIVMFAYIKKWQGFIKVVPTILIVIIFIFSSYALLTGQTYNEVIVQFEHLFN